MTDVLVLDLVEKGLVTNSVTLWIAYDHRYGQEPSRGTAKFSEATNSSRRIIQAVDVQYDLFTDPYSQEKEKNLQRAVLEVKKRYGKNAIMRGANLLDCSTYRERNNQIGGHRA